MSTTLTISNSLGNSYSVPCVVEMTIISAEAEPIIAELSTANVSIGLAITGNSLALIGNLPESGFYYNFSGMQIANTDMSTGNITLRF